MDTLLDLSVMTESPPGAQNPELELLTAEEVASLLKVDNSYVYKLIKTRRLRSLRLGKRCIRIRKEHLAEFILSM